MQNEKILTTCACVITGVGVIYLGILSWNAVKAHNYIGVSEEQSHSFSVRGEGTSIGIPDIAKISLGYEVEKDTVAEAQQDNTEKMNELIKKLKTDFDIDEKDIKTNSYSVYPRYDWNDGKQSLSGYQVSQNVEVKVRDLDKVNEILDFAGGLNLNQVGSLSFEIDDTEELEKEAREEAIEAAKQKAKELADISGITLGRIISIYESNSRGITPTYVNEYKTLSAYGAGGDIDMESTSIEAGSSEIIINISLEYEIL